jgi:hypothetical protein
MIRNEIVHCLNALEIVSKKQRFYIRVWFEIFFFMGFYNWKNPA